MKIKLLLTLAVIVIMLASGGCVEKEDAIESTDYEEISLENAETSISYPGFQISSSNGEVAYGRMEYKNVEQLYRDAENTWVIRAEDSSAGGEGYVQAIIKIEDINHIPDISIDLPNGNTIYAKDFRMDPDYYRPRLLANQEGFRSISISYFPYKDSSITGEIGGNNKWKENPGVVLQPQPTEVSATAYLITLSARY